MDTSEPPSTWPMWGFATLMVTVVSCCSLIGVSIMPLISGPSYKTFNTLFTGLAVGSLLGSAVFSLIPQAFGLNSPEIECPISSNTPSTPRMASRAFLWKSLIVFFGVYLFYCSERFMRIYFHRKERKHQKHDRHMQLKDAISTHGGDHQNSSAQGIDQTNTEATTEICLSKDDEHEDNHTSGHSDYPQGYIHPHQHGVLKPHEVITKALKSSRSEVLQPARIAPVAWMIIIGDGLHNFIDGLSIGASFSKSIWGGLTISTAVIFEEFPHELGDFAVLIASGMTVKQALGFNFLSACTCYIGMIFGILLGDMAESASFIFALAAGMFFYISLVDMMGELSAALEECKDSTKDSLHMFMMQNIGILSGITIIFLLAYFGPSG